MAAARAQTCRDAAIATVDATGRARGAGAGTTTVTATLGTIAGSATLTVNPPLLQQLTVTPSLPVLLVPETVQFTATGAFSDGTTQDLTGSVTWASTSTAVATITATGLATALAKGRTTIRATFGGLFREAILTVLSSSPLLALRPAPPCAICSYGAGGFVFFTATGTFQDGTTQDLTYAVTWASSDPTVATITASGVAVTLAPGTTTITVARGAVSGTYDLRVYGAALEVAPLSPTRAVGQTVQFTANEGGGHTAFLGPITWTSTNPAVASIASTGLATALAPGTTTIRASAFSSALYTTITGETTLTVLPVLTALSIPPGALSSPAGETFQLQALGTFADASTRDLTTLVTWATSNAAVATVTAGGLVTTQGIGVANITATRDGIAGTLNLTVTGPRPTITITSPSNGATITADRVIVRGTVSGAPGDIGVTVNGFLALVNGNQWAFELPLVQGTSPISVTATDSTGAQFTTSIDLIVPQATSAPLLLQAVPDSGVSPLTVAFTAINRTGRTLVQFELDALGTGGFGPATPSFVGVNGTYTGAGLLFPTLRATDNQGVQYTATTIVNVEDPLAVTARFQARWRSFKARLQAGDIVGALAHLSPTLQPRLQTILQQLGPDLPAIGAGLGDLEVIDQQGNLAETAIVQQEDGVPHLYSIYFRRDSLGRWLIEEM